MFQAIADVVDEDRGRERDVKARLHSPLPARAIPRPDPVTDAIIREPRDNKRDYLMEYLRKIERHLRRNNSGHLRIADLLDWFTGECYNWANDYVSGLPAAIAYADDATPQAITDFSDAFLQMATGEVRIDSAIALYTFWGGSCVT